MGFVEEWESKYRELELEFEEFKGVSEEMEVSLLDDVSAAEAREGKMGCALDKLRDQLAKAHADMNQRNKEDTTRINTLVSDLAAKTDKNADFSKVLRELETKTENFEQRDRIIRAQLIEEQANHEAAVEEMELYKGEVEDLETFVSTLQMQTRNLQAELDALHELKSETDELAQSAGFETRAKAEMAKYKEGLDGQLEAVRTQLVEERGRSEALALEVEKAETAGNATKFKILARTASREQVMESAKEEEIEGLKQLHQREIKQQSIIMKHTVGAEVGKVSRLEEQVERLQAQLKELSADAAVGRNQRKTESDFTSILAGLKQEMATVHEAGQTGSSEAVSLKFAQKSEQASKRMDWMVTEMTDRLVTLLASTQPY
jgi:ABC-type transporter Mla subunit MlaD